jgi:hypothetical protein
MSKKLMILIDLPDGFEIEKLGYTFTISSKRNKHINLIRSKRLLNPAYDESLRLQASIIEAQP